MGAKVIKVLFVDDEPFILSAYQRMLRNTAFECSTLSDSRLLFQQAELSDFDIIAVDHQMPHVSGIELLQQLQEKYPHIKRVLISGNLNFAHQELPTTVSFDAALEKPFTKADLITCLSNLASL